MEFKRITLPEDFDEAIEQWSHNIFDKVNALKQRGSEQYTEQVLDLLAHIKPKDPGNASTEELELYIRVRNFPGTHKELIQWINAAREGHEEKDIKWWIQKLKEYSPESNEGSIIDAIIQAAENSGIGEVNVDMGAEPDHTRDGGAVADMFRKLTAELVIAWKYLPQKTDKAELEDFMLAQGLQKIGAEGEVLPMVGRLHQAAEDCEAEIMPGDKVEVIRIGWIIHDGIGEFKLEPAIVKPSKATGYGSQGRLTKSAPASLPTAPAKSATYLAWVQQLRKNWPKSKPRPSQEELRAMWESEQAKTA